MYAMHKINEYVKVSLDFDVLERKKSWKKNRESM